VSASSSDDLDSGYVRVLQELMAAGWSNMELGAAVRELLGGWVALLAEVAREAERRHGPLGPFTAEEAATLVASASSARSRCCCSASTETRSQSARRYDASAC
jgi:hypothetical protein